MRIQNNISAINSHRLYTVNQGALAKNLEKLSSGYRINRAGDDAAGLAISEKMRAQIRGLTMASKNSLDAISLVQTAEGALQSTHNILQRMRELAVQSASDTNETAIDRNALNLEFQQLIKEIDDTANKTVFNDQRIIDGTFSKNVLVAASKTSWATNAWVGANAIAAGRMTASIRVTLTMVKSMLSLSGEFGTITTGASKIYLTAVGATVMTMSIGSSGLNGGGTSSIAKDSTLNGTWQLSYDQASGRFMAENLTNGKKLSAAPAAMTKGGIISINFGYGIVLTVNASGSINSSDFIGLNGSFVIYDAEDKQDEKYQGYAKIDGEAVKLQDGMTNIAFQNTNVSFQLKRAWTTFTSQAKMTAAYSNNGVFTIDVFRVENKDLVIQTGANQGDETRISIDKMDSLALGVRYADISGRMNASAAITQVNNALNIVSTQRATLGALQNRLEFKISNLDNSAENLQAAESRIRDTDMAKEMTAFMKNNILFQASTAMLAQANALPQGVLQLLG